MLSRRLFEGPNIEKLLARIQSELGPAAQVVSAEKVRRGGMGGFFARETYQVIVEAPEDERPTRLGMWGARRRPSAPASTPVPVAVETASPAVSVPSTEGAPFADLLRRLTENAAPAPPPPADRSSDLAMPPGAPDTPSVDAVVDDDLTAVLGADEEWQSAETWLSEADSDSLPDSDLPAVPAPGPVETLPVTADPVAAMAEGAPLAAIVPADGMVTAETEIDGPMADEPASGETTTFDLTTEPAPSGAAAPGRHLQPVPLPGAETKAGLAGITPARARPALKKMGVPTALLPADGRLGLVPALYRSLSKMPAAPAVRLQPGEVMAVIGDADRALELASRLALSIGLDPGEVVVASPGDGSGSAERTVIGSGQAAEAAAEEWATRARPTVVSISAAPGSGRETWAGNVIDALQPAAVWGVVEATRKPEDVSAWSRAVGQVDALALEDLDSTTSPAAVLGTGIPVALLDGQLASAESWTALLAARLRAAA